MRVAGPLTSAGGLGVCLAPCPYRTRLRALDQHVALHLGNGAQRRQHQFSGARCQVKLPELKHDDLDLAPRRPVDRRGIIDCIPPEPADDEGFAVADITEQRLELRPLGGGNGGADGLVGETLVNRIPGAIVIKERNLQGRYAGFPLPSGLIHKLNNL